MALATGLVGCSGSSSSSPATSTASGPATTAGKGEASATTVWSATGTTAVKTGGIAWAPCGERLECATVPVPVDWADPSGPTLDLAAIRHPASKPDQRIGTIFAEPGGPGDTGVGLIRGSGDELDTWGDGRFDWVGWDPRGTYASSPVDCFRSNAEAEAFWAGAKVPSTPAEADAFTQRTGDLARRCGEVMGPLLSHISTTDTVRDLDHLREQLGEDRITYVGLSYGTYVGQVYANLFPHRVRAMLLDGIVEPISYTTDAEDRLHRSVSSTNDVFDELLRTCEAAGPTTCALAGHGESPRARVDRLLQRAAAGPIPAPGATPPGELSYSDVLATSFAPLRDPALWPGYAAQLDAAVEGDPSALATAAAQTRTVTAWSEATKSAAISCLDGPASTPVGDWRTVIGDTVGNPSLGLPVQGWWLWAPCASGWPARSDDRYTGPWNARTATPILLIGTRHDPNTGYQNAVDAQALLGNAVLLTHDGYGHLSSSDPSRCVEAARVRYLVDLQTPPAGTVCPADRKPFG